ncbi:hypothetical protein PSEUDO8O_20117 [Pseudomonas sp. 8O]|nr:hypothetical protein PSEUDO8O_20117 [Pseudomonas sp. 8O]
MFYQAQHEQQYLQRTPLELHLNPEKFRQRT